MAMTPRLRNLVLAMHVATSVGLLGAVASFLALAIIGLASRDPQVVRAAYVAMKPVAWFVIIPLMAASLLIGIVESLGTTWGLFRHYWVVVKLLLTIFATIVLLLQMTVIGRVAAAAAQATLAGSDLLDARMALILHSAGGLLVLLLPVVLSVYKPRGRTRYGQRVALAP
jgi:hypothetical protein